MDSNELLNLYSSPNIILIIKSGTINERDMYRTWRDWKENTKKVIMWENKA